MGHIDGLDRGSLQGICSRIREHRIEQVFIDGSNLGEAVRTVKACFPDIEVVTFFHNVEARFFLGALRHSRTARAAAVMVANYLAERKAVRHSDKLLCLSHRDSRLLARLYGRQATHVSPIALEDKIADGQSEPRVPAEKFALFVGGLVYANQAGITWFADHVAPHVSIRTYVVGHGLDTLAHRLERSGNLTVVGSVPSLADWYERAQVVVAPIFDGSGMKTKVAEALMFGKRVIGTPEAFTGYEEVAAAAGDICRTAAEFVTALNRYAQAPFQHMNVSMRRLYEENYSYPAARRRLREVMGAHAGQIAATEP
jgi:glycosyltransferase involved in cell wall biosynthesis